MEQDFRPHPVLVNYEASRDGVVRHRRLKKQVGWLNNSGYLRFTVGGKTYYIHRTIHECFYGLIKDGFVIDHKIGVKTDNALENLEVVTQSQNTKRGRTGTCKSVLRRPVKSFDLETNEEKIFQSMNAAAKYFDICMPSVQKVAEKIQKSALSKKNGHRIQFSYLSGDNS
jgi:hypothetical protein